MEVEASSRLAPQLFETTVLRTFSSLLLPPVTFDRLSWIMPAPAPTSIPTAFWLPTNQRRDFTFVTPFVDFVDTKGDQQKPLLKGRTFSADINGDTARVQSCHCYAGRGR